MPRIAKSEREKTMDAIARRIRHHYNDALYERGLDCRSAAKTFGMGYDTMHRRLANPSQFTLGELVTIANTMNISLATLVSGKEASTNG